MPQGGEDSWQEYPDNGVVEAADFPKHLDEEEGDEEDDGEDDDDDDYEDSEDEDDYNFEDEDEEDGTADEESLPAETLTTVSNETDPSDFLEDLEEIERQTAFQFAEPPWSGWVRTPFKVAAACMLPFVLAALLLYVFVKFWGYFFQCFFDIFNLVLRIAWLVIRVALSPLYVLWMALVPGYIRSYLAQTYEENLGEHVRQAVRFVHLLQNVVTDFPRYTAACYFAGVETFVDPARARCAACLYRLVGQRAEEWVLQPWHDQEINRVAKRRRGRLEKAQFSDPAFARAFKKLGPKRAKAKARAKRERSKRAKIRKKMEALEITLMLPIGDKARHHHILEHGDLQKVRLPKKPRSKMASRVMVVERRYAIAAGLVWCMIGATVLTIILDGTEGERCLICSERPDVGLRVCRNGEGQDCAFELHMWELVGSIAVICVGGLLTVYALFLYKPMQKAAKAVKAEDSQKELFDRRRRRMAVKDVDPEMAATQLLLDRLDLPGFNQRWRRRYMRFHANPLVACVVRCLEALLRRFFRFEEEHNLRERSIALQDALLFMAIGWFQALAQCMTMVQAPETEEEATEARRVRRFTLRKRISAIGRQQRCICYRWRERSLEYLRETRFGPCLDRIPCLRRRSKGAARVSVGSGFRQEGRRPKLLEEVLDKFGLTPAKDNGGDLEAGHRRLSFGSAGGEETQREFGLEDVDAAVPEEELQFQGESDDDAKDSESDDSDEDAVGWNTEDERAAEPVRQDWQQEDKDGEEVRSDRGGQSDASSDKSGSAESSPRQPILPRDTSFSRSPSGASSPSSKS